MEASCYPFSVKKLSRVTETVIPHAKIVSADKPNTTICELSNVIRITDLYQQEMEGSSMAWIHSKQTLKLVCIIKFIACDILYDFQCIIRASEISYGDYRY
jgi:hypothetical protein